MIDGVVFVIKSIDCDMIVFFEKVFVFIIEEGGLISYVVVVGLSFGILVIVGFENVIFILIEG